jgi:hypothetical protein
MKFHFNWRNWFRRNPFPTAPPIPLLQLEAQSEEQSSPGFRVAPQEHYIDDGARYALPVVLTESEHNALAANGKLDAFLEANETFRFQFDTPQRTAADLPVLMPVEDPLREVSWATRRQILANVHSVYERNPLANAMLQYTADFVIGQGFSLKCKNKDVEQVLEDFINSTDNAIREYERQAAIDLQLDGELFLRFFVGVGDTKGQIVSVPLRPWECQYIKTEMGFFRRPLFYHFVFFKSEGDAPTGQETEVADIPADEIIHIAINRHAYEVRGRSELYRILPWLRADKEFLENRARQNHWRNALLWWVKVANAGAPQMAAIRSRWAIPPPPGSVVVESANVELQALSNSVGAADVSEDGRQIKLRSIIGSRMAEYMFADGQNANLASATAQELPALTRFSQFQTVLIEQLWYPLFKRVIQAAIDAGLLPEEVEEQDADGDTLYEEPEMTPSIVGHSMTIPADMPMNGAMNMNGMSDAMNMGSMMPMAMQTQIPRMIETLEAFDVSYTPIKSEDILPLTQALAVHEDREWADKQTIQDKLGYDSAIVDKRLESDKQETLKAQAQGLEPLTANQMMQAQPPAPNGKQAQPDTSGMY